MIIKVFGSKGEGKKTLLSFLYHELSKRGVKLDLNLDTDFLYTPEQVELYFAKMSKLGPLECELKAIPFKKETKPGYITEKPE